ncbi:hypothetical protein GQ44DRAFT_627624 [Phaeosphaeriaceae sp. PMI808]|nr:hypothetical protein GQ44DRAFT_627624 [Phaeosphaeriaceae sp. PMI808]
MEVDSHLATPAGTRVTTIALAFTLVAGMVVFLRLFARLLLTRVAGFEDAGMVFAMVLSIGLTVMTSEQVFHGLGRHSTQLNANERVVSLRAFWTCMWIYSLALTITKISILIQYFRIFPVRRFRKACYFLLGVVVTSGAWAVFSNVLLCNPIAFFWDKSIKDGNCMDRMVIWFSNAGLNIAQDLVILLLPMPLIQTLQISQSQKRGLVFMFALGTSVSLVSVIRLYSLDNIATSNDLPFDNTAHAALSVVEVNIGIICACLPAMRSLFALMMPKYFSATAQYTNIPVELDIERPAIHKHIRTPSNNTRNNTNSTSTTGSNTPHIGHPQPLRPTQSRTPSGRVSITNTRPSTPGQASHVSHSRSGSNLSIDIAAAEARSNIRFQGRVNPLRLSPITPLNPPDYFGLPLQPFGPRLHTENVSDASGIITPGPRRPKTPGSVKPLPLTPYPVGSGG